ncbi:MAG TPA: phosphate ABC transporter permease subunit PstC, partial [Pricia sp.]|nr:phosphate ABC transporter permease subunit PstC [Pricia sp.]
GETMTVLMVTGNAPAMPHSFFDSIRTMTATIAIELGEVPYGTTHYYAIFAVGTILFLMSLSVNIIAELVTARYRSRRI